MPDTKCIDEFERPQTRYYGMGGLEFPINTIYPQEVPVGASTMADYTRLVNDFRRGNHQHPGWKPYTLDNVYFPVYPSPIDDEEYINVMTKNSKMHFEFDFADVEVAAVANLPYEIRATFFLWYTISKGGYTIIDPARFEGDMGFSISLNPPKLNPIDFVN